MTVESHGSADEFSQLIERGKKSKRRRRLRMICRALEELAADEAAESMKSSRRRVRERVARGNRKGPARWKDQPGRGAKWPPHAEQQAERKLRPDAGPRAEYGGCLPYGEDVRRILLEEFHVVRSPSATYYLWHRLGYASPVSRAKHRKTNPERQRRFLKKICSSRSIRFAASSPGNDR